MFSKSPRWILPATALAILPLMILGALLVQRLVRLNEERYEQEVTSAELATEISARTMLHTLETELRDPLDEISMAHMKDAGAFESALRESYFGSKFIGLHEFTDEATLRASGEMELFPRSQHVCEDAVVAAIRHQHQVVARELMGYVASKKKYKYASLANQADARGTRLQWVHVDSRGALVRGCDGCAEKLEKYGAWYDDHNIALLVLTRVLPASEETDAGLYGAVVPAYMLKKKILASHLERFNSGEEKMPRHLLRVVSRRGELLLPNLDSVAPEVQQSLKLSGALHRETFLTAGSPWLLEAVALSGFDKSQVRAENSRWLMLMSVSALLLVFGALALSRSFLHQIGVTRLRTHLLSNISHELKTPLSLIRLYTETLEAGRAKTEDDRKKFLSIISRETVRLAHLIDNLLDVQRIEENRKQYSYAQVRPDRVVRSTVEAFRLQLAEQGFELRLDIDEDLPLIYIDEEAITQALVNLLDNAAKYSQTNRDIRVRCGKRDDKVCISVQDRGIGIPRREQDKIFQSFYRVEKTDVHDVKGSGLGLAVVSHVAAAHGGRVQVESTPGAGSTFTLCIPNDFNPEAD
jgi:signal transduction histidine kinase